MSDSHRSHILYETDPTEDTKRGKIPQIIRFLGAIVQLEDTMSILGRLGGVHQRMGTRKPQ